MTGPNSRSPCPDCGLPLPPGAGGPSACPGCSLRLALSGSSGTAKSPTPAPAPNASAPPAGLRSRFFADYEILGELARGGMGVVYRARQLSLNRPVALKMIQAGHLLSDEARLRFRVEIEAVAQLQHPNIVPLYESGEHDGVHYFTMRLVEGGDLAAHLARRPRLRDVVALLVKVCRAVQHAHQRGILHRDLKPSNILLDERGEPLVADFGLAKSVDQESGFTFTSTILGSPNYMAPEQAAGGATQTTTAVDVYGLGAVLYQALTGRPPFEAPTPVETLRQVVDCEPADPRRLNPDVDADLATIALKCLRKEPAGRYGTAGDLAADLDSWLAGLPIQARPRGRLTTAGRWIRRHPATAALAAGLGITLAALVTGTVLAAMRIRQAEQRAAAHLRESLQREATSLRQASQFGHREEGLRLLREAAGLPGAGRNEARLRDEFIATLARRDLRFVPFAPEPPAIPAGGSAVDPPFKFAAAVGRAGEVIVSAVDGSPAPDRTLVSGPHGPARCIHGFSPTGSHLVVGHSNSTTVWEVAAGACVWSAPGTNTTPTFHADGESLWLQLEPNRMVRFSLATGEEQYRWSARATRPGGRPSGWHLVACSPDARFLAGTSGRSQVVELLDPATGRPVRLLTNSAHALALAWAPDGRRLAVATADHRIVVWDAVDARPTGSSPPLVAPATALAFHPRLDWLAAACGDAQIRFLNLQEWRFGAAHAGTAPGLLFNGTGERVGPVWLGDQPGFLAMPTSPIYTAEPIAPAWVHLDAGHYGTDGTVLAAGHVDTVVLWDPVRNRRLRVRDDWRIGACAFHPRDHVLLVGATNGLLQYRYQLSPAGRLTFSRHEVLQPGDHWRAVVFDGAGGRIAALDNRRDLVVVLDATGVNVLATTGPHPGADSLAMSPDGRWLATGSRRDRSLRVWDAATGQPVASLPAGVHPRGLFSPDSRWLLATGDHFQRWETGTWQSPANLPPAPDPDQPGAAAFSPDNSLLALVVERFSVQLLRPDDLTPVAILRPPESLQIRGLAFTPDSTRLTAFTSEGQIATWNLKSLREQLTGSQLDLPAIRIPTSPR